MSKSRHTEAQMVAALKLMEAGRKRPRFGYRRIHALLDENPPVNHKRVWRV